MSATVPVPTPKRKRWRGLVLRRVLLFAVVPYCFIVLMLAQFQRSLIYVPARSKPTTDFRGGLADDMVQQITVQTHDGLILNGWHVPARLERCGSHEESEERLAAGGPVVLYCPGNGGHRGYRVPFYRVLAEKGANVFAFDYRGYGDNPGKPTEPDLEKDAKAVWEYLTKTRQVDPARIVIYGESLGGGVATRLAANVCEAGTPPGGLTLCATFSSLIDAAAVHYPWLPVRYLLVDRYLSDEWIKKVTCPILMLHGTRDEIVPYRLGKRLFEAAPGQSQSGIAKRLVTFPHADHNDILETSTPEYSQAVDEFFGEVVPGVVNRQR